MRGLHVCFDEGPTAEEVLRDVVTDYADKCCDKLDTCSCSMARAWRMTSELRISPDRSHDGH